MLTLGLGISANALIIIGGICFAMFAVGFAVQMLASIEHSFDRARRDVVGLPPLKKVDGSGVRAVLWNRLVFPLRRFARLLLGAQ